MKQLCMMLMFLFVTVNNANAQDCWTPFRGHVQTTVVQSYPVNPVPQPVVVYQWVPVIVNQNTIVDQQCLFRRTQTVTVQPVVQWIYQPVIIYR